jgi:hypothetical protein
MLKFDLDKKAQAAETLTWVVATIIIIFLLVSSIYVSSLLGKSKNLEVKKIESYSKNNWMENKTNFALGINNQNEDVIKSWVAKNSLGNG